MTRKILALLSFLVLAYLSVRGGHHFGKWWSPVLLLAAAVGLAWAYAHFLLENGAPKPVPAAPARQKWLAALVGALGIGLCYEELRKIFVAYTPPSKWSDVLPQLEAQFDRWARGEMPYQSVHFETYDAYPVYMPLHWLPVGLSRFFQMDVRWSGYIILLLAAGLAGWLLARRAKMGWPALLIGLLPSVGLWAFIRWGGLEIPVSYELLIAAYYLVLAAALAAGHTGWVLAGLILCLLSRYTLVFWLPLFALIFWQNRPFSWNLRFWGAVAAAFVLLYAVPFLSKDPSILRTGIEYHNHAAADEWRGGGDPPVSWTMERGIHFAGHMKRLFSDAGSAEAMVFRARAVQAMVMILLFGMGLLAYRRWRGRVDLHQFCLLALHCVVWAFYFFGPLTYRYYLIMPLMISAVMCAQMLLPSAARSSD